MRRAMTEWERYTCMRFKPVTGRERNSLRFQNGQGYEHDLITCFIQLSDYVEFQG